MHSQLDGETDNIYPEATDSLTNNLYRNQMESGFRAATIYNLTPTMNVMASLPLRYLYIWDNNNKHQSTSSFVFIDPSFTLNWQLTSRWASFLTYGIRHSVVGIDNSYSQPILLNYRLLMNHNQNIDNKLSHNAMWNIQYKNPFSSLFSSLFILYTRTEQNLIHDYTYNGLLTTRQSILNPHANNHLTSSFSIGQDVESWRTNMSINMTHMSSWSQQLIQSQLVNAHTQSLTISPRIISRLASIASVEYGTTYSRFLSKLRFSNNTLPIIQSWAHNLQINLFPTKDFVVGIRTDYFLNKGIAASSQNIWFGDIALKYKLKSVELALDWNNIFNAKNYIVNSYTDTGRFYYAYQLRPAEVLLRV